MCERGSLCQLICVDPGLCFQPSSSSSSSFPFPPHPAPLLLKPRHVRSPGPPVTVHLPHRMITVNVFPPLLSCLDRKCQTCLYFVRQDGSGSSGAVVICTSAPETCKQRWKMLFTDREGVREGLLIVPFGARQWVDARNTKRKRGCGGGIIR